VGLPGRGNPSSSEEQIASSYRRQKTAAGTPPAARGQARNDKAGFYLSIRRRVNYFSQLCDPMKSFVDGRMTITRCERKSQPMSLRAAEGGAAISHPARAKANPANGRDISILSNIYHPFSYRSRHSGFTLLIKDNFLTRDPAFNCFSLRRAK
jgi:hypothetical protein